MRFPSQRRSLDHISIQIQRPFRAPYLHPFMQYRTRARRRALKRRSPVTRGFFARNNVATRYLQKKQPLNGPPLTRSRRGNGFRGFPAAHPKPVFSSALFTLITAQRQREPATHETTSYCWYSVILPPHGTMPCTANWQNTHSSCAYTS